LANCVCTYGEELLEQTMAVGPRLGMLGCGCLGRTVACMAGSITCEEACLILAHCLKGGTSMLSTHTYIESQDSV